MNETSPHAAVNLRSRLREKLPEIFIEAGSIVVALLLAMGISAWHEQRQQQELVAQARAAIVSEVRENLAELDKLRTSLRSNIQELQAATHREEKHGDSLAVNIGLALLSEAAWRATLATGALQHIDYAWVMRVGKLYELQELVVHAQSLAVDQLADINDASLESVRVLAQRLLSRQRALLQLADGLDGNYHELVDAKL